MTREQRFAKAFAACAVALGAGVDEARLRVFYKVLEPIPIELIERAAEHFMRTEKRYTLPPPAAWLELCQAFAAESPAKRFALTGVVNKASYYCERCEDTFWCFVAPEGAIHLLSLAEGTDRERTEKIRLTMTRCPCREHNPNYDKPGPKFVPDTPVNVTKERRWDHD